MKRVLLALLLAVAAHQASADEVRPFVRGSWGEILRAHAGQPTVVHVWGLTCGPCRVEMPQWGKLLGERDDLRLVTVHADLVPGEPTAVAAMLRRTGLARAENWNFSDGFVERLRFEIDPQWQGQIPITFLIAADGSTTPIEGMADPADIRAWLDDQAKPAATPGPASSLSAPTPNPHQH
jgi:thiol-disulfide isomerase/thioredoxin